MAKDVIYGPFFDEEFFYYYDKTTLELENLEIYEPDIGFIGFDHLERICALGRDGNLDVIFSGRITLRKTSYLCEGGLKMLLQQAQKRDASMDAHKLQKACRRDGITVEIQCQLALMPVCYLAKRPAHSILIFSKNLNNIDRQRRYVVKTFHVVCFRLSELTLHRCFVLKFVMDACEAHGDGVPREDRDVHWLVEVYMNDYSAVFKKYGRPRLHRSEVYDHFATHAEWLGKVFSHKTLVNKARWADWVVEATRLRKKAKRAGSKWGSPMTTQLAPNYNMDIDSRDTIVDVPSSDTDGSDKDYSSSESESDDSVKYSYDPCLRSRVHSGLLLPMPAPTWYWTCNIKKQCPFVIDIGIRRARDAPCMDPLNEQEKDYILRSRWGLYDRKLIKIWKKMCQAHMDWHWREAGLVLDHEKHLIYGIEAEEAREQSVI